MKKLALNIEELAVETFSTDSDGTGPQRGTVQARESYSWPTEQLERESCGFCQTGFTDCGASGTFFWPCEVSDGGTCNLSCWGGSCGLTCSCFCETQIEC